MVERGNPAAHIEAFREQRRERFLTSEELACLGDAIRGAETTGIAWEIDEAKPTAEHIPKEKSRHKYWITCGRRAPHRAPTA